MKFYQETTQDWSTPTPNHTYLLNDDKSKMYGYITVDSKKNVVFKKPINFDSRRRTFRVVQELGEINLKEAQGQTWRVDGSKGNSYLVQKLDNVYTCNCSGFKFRGECRHIKGVEANE